MKKKMIEIIEPLKTRKSGNILTVQMVENILIMNCYKDKKFLGRYCMNTDTYEYASFDAESGMWCKKNMRSTLGYQRYWDDYKSISHDFSFGKKTDEILIQEQIGYTSGWKKNSSAFDIIEFREKEYNEEKRERLENNRRMRLDELEKKMSPLPEDLSEWLYDCAGEGADYAFYDKEKNMYGCTCCQNEFISKKKLKHNEETICPSCGKKIIVKTRTNSIIKNTRFELLQNLDEEKSVERLFDAEIHWKYAKRFIRVSEAERVILLRKYKKNYVKVYYNQYCKYMYDSKILNQNTYFDRKNPANRRFEPGFLYPNGIEEALKGTFFEPWIRIFTQLSAAGLLLDYNKLMISTTIKGALNVVEYLFKGKFYRLLNDVIFNLSSYWNEYYGPLNIRGKNLKEVFRINDQQKINRIRDKNGDNFYVHWMQYADKERIKILDETLDFLSENHIEQNDILFIEKKMSVQKIVNYLKKQKETCYQTLSIKEILGQWADYMNMCEKLNKKTDDEMIFRPRELKRRHDECQEEINKQNMMKEMQENKKRYKEESKRMRDKFPEAEKILKEVKKKYEYENEEYKMIVPLELLDIVADGQALHHCAGSSDRYFDRICQRETYICFLRRVKEPDVPYYTIEFEPTGTIRQHRGYLDEEPGIEEIRGFLKEWQQVIKKRLTKKDYELAETSKVLRQKNINELKEKNNTRVLQGLIEDFMEAV